MGWFKEKIDVRIGSLIANAVKAYIERAELSDRLSILDPTLTGIEMAVLWAASVAAMEKTHNEEEAASVETEATLYKMTRELFDSYCQSYIEKVSKSSLKLDMESDQIQESFTPTLKAMSSQRLTAAGHIMEELVSNAATLAAARIAILRAGLIGRQEKLAAEYAVSLVTSRRDLSEFERKQTMEWVAAASWSTS